MTEERAKRKLTAILSADVKGYSRLMEDDEEGTVRTITAYREVMVDRITRQNGRVVDAKGDNILAEFASVVDAVRCAVEIQKELGKRNDQLPENRRMEFRIGINLGDVIEEKETIYGDGVNIAARLEALADGGGVCISGTAFDQIGKKLSIGYEYFGEQTVKNIEKPVRAYKVLMEPEYAGKVIGQERLKPKHWRWAAIGGLVVLVVVVAALVIWTSYFRPAFEPASEESMAFPLPEKPSIAVLPFDNMSGDPEQDYIADGFTENIITGLSQIPEMFVIARNSVFTYKGKPVKVKQVSEELGVKYVLEGSIQRSADRLRVTAQLVNATEGQHLWAERYDRELKELFALQDEITMKILKALNVKLVRGESARLILTTDSFEAWGHVIKGYSLLYRPTKENLLKAMEHSKKAAELDPDFLDTLLLEAHTHQLMVRMGWSESPAESIKRAIKLAKKVLALNDNLPDGHIVMSQISLLQGQHDKSIEEGEKAIALKPSSATAHIFLAQNLLYAGKAEAAIVHAKNAMRLSPYYPTLYLMILADSYLLAGRYDESLAVNKQMLEHARQGKWPIYVAHLGLAASYMMLGQEEKARFHADEALKANPTWSLEDFKRRNPYKNPADMERMLDPLRKAGIPETPPLPLPDKPSIAVLPFVNMSVDPEQEYFSDGISEEIITALSKTSKLFVIARTSSFKYKGKEVDVRTVGRELGVRYVLEGSVRKSEDKVRITAQLIDAETNQHLWAHRYDRDLQDIFAVQDEITMKILTALQVKLTEGEQARLRFKKVKNLDIYLRAMEANSLWAEGTKESHIRFGQVARDIIDMAPEWVGGYRLMAWHQWYLAKVGKSPRESMATAFKLAQKVLHMDESDSSSHALVGSIYLLMRKYEEAIAAGERSVELDPNGAMARGLLGMTLSFADKPDEAIGQFNCAIRLNPFAPYWYFYRLGQSYMQKGEYEEALKAYKKALQRAPDAFSTHAHLAVLYVLLDRQEEAGAAANKVLELFPNFSVERIAKTLPFKNQAFHKLFVDAMRKAGLK